MHARREYRNHFRHREFVKLGLEKSPVTILFALKNRPFHSPILFSLERVAVPLPFPSSIDRNASRSGRFISSGNQTFVPCKIPYICLRFNPTVEREKGKKGESAELLEAWLRAIVYVVRIQDIGFSSFLPPFSPPRSGYRKSVGIRRGRFVRLRKKERRDVWQSLEGGNNNGGVQCP